jgi:hypothetical protein
VIGSRKRPPGFGTAAMESGGASAIAALAAIAREMAFAPGHEFVRIEDDVCRILDR